MTTTINTVLHSSLHWHWCLSIWTTVQADRKRQSLTLSSYHLNNETTKPRKVNKGRERWGELPEVAQKVCGRGRNRTQVSWMPNTLAGKVLLMLPMKLEITLRAPSPLPPKKSKKVLITWKQICKRKQEMKTIEGWHDYRVLIRTDRSQEPWCTTRQQEVTFGVRAMLICKPGSISLSELRDRLSQSSREGSHYPCREQEIRIF